jgi:hypothetical protein
MFFFVVVLGWNSKSSLAVGCGDARRAETHRKAKKKKKENEK